jgi:hypothetical protein
VFALSFNEVIGSSFVRSTCIGPSRDITYAILADARALRTTSMRITAFQQPRELTRKSRYARAAQLVRGWLRDESGHDEATWPILERELREGRIQFGE